MRRSQRILAVLIGLVLVDSSVALLHAQSGYRFPLRRRFSGLATAEETYQQNEQRRLGQIDRQVLLNDQMYWNAGAFGSYVPGVFEAWPLTSGDIWGYPLVLPRRQPVDQWSRQVGPNTWLSEPVYNDADEAGNGQPPVVAGAEPSGEVPRNVRPPKSSAAGERVALPAPSPSPTGPREF